MAKHKPVTFLSADGEEISNDPVWQAQKLIASSQADSDDNSDEDLPQDQGPYDNLSGKELKELAKERGVDIKGLTKVGEVRSALQAADEAEGDEEESEEEE